MSPTRLLPAMALLMAALAAHLAVPCPVAAAPAEPSRQPEEAAPAEMEVKEGELEDFVNAFVRVIGVQHGYLMLMQLTESPAEREALQEAAIEDMEAAVREEGLSPERYNAIATAVEEDPQLQARVEDLLQQMAEAQRLEGAGEQPARPPAQTERPAPGQPAPGQPAID